MKELFRDTVIGHLIRWTTGGRWLQHAEDRDPSLWHMYVSTEKSSRLASYGTLDPLAEPKHPNVGESNTPTPQSETSEQIYPVGAQNTPRRIVTPVKEPSIEADATEQIGAVESASGETKAKEQSQSQGTPASDEKGQKWVAGAMGKEGMDISLTEGQVDGDPALQMTSSNNEKAWNAVQLEAGDKGIAAPEDAKKDPGKGRVVNVVVWFGPTDPDVSRLPLLR